MQTAPLVVRLSPVPLATDTAASSPPASQTAASSPPANTAVSSSPAASSMGPLAEQKSPVLQSDKPKALNMTIEDLSTVKNQLKAFVASKKRREVEASLAEMTDDDYMSSFNAMMKGD